ncbi:hypothetical protein F5Y17DRAFT_334043 [Xylariaceae sp. FL0594]|nr:hypothetical protein F5Y17DRAFT_334043 [Xylariaceae sp. FL0594]
MQEHIRRAHPEKYISKLPATEESFLLMISTPPSQAQTVAGPHAQGPPDHNALFRDESSAPVTPRHADEHTGRPAAGSLLPAASAAAALAQLGGQHTFETDWDSETGWHSDTEGRRIPRSTIELPPLQYHAEPTSEPFPPMNSGSGRRELLPSILANSPPGRSTTLPPIQRSLGPSRPRKQSVTKRGHRKQKSRGVGTDWLRRVQNDENYLSDRKAHSLEPSAHYGTRWEDLIDAATSATEDIDEDRTPVPQSPPMSINRASLPPFSHPQFQGYQASPLQHQALTPPPFGLEAPEPFPSVESGESGDAFHMGAVGLPHSSPNYSSQDVDIYCAACQGLSKLRESYACTECICGLCRPCVDILMEEQGAQRKCPRCATIGGRFKPFKLDIR